MIIEFEAQLWQWAARPDESWVFVSLPPEPSEEIRELTAGVRRGFGSVRVRARIGATTWKTSIFPGGDGPYVLPVKRAVRTAQRLAIGDTTSVTVELIDSP